MHLSLGFCRLTQRQDVNSESIAVQQARNADLILARGIFKVGMEHASKSKLSYCQVHL